MGYTSENQKIDAITETLKVNLKEYREIAERRLMSNDWNVTYKLKLRAIVEKMFDLQLELNEL